jgi:hypothetical protein
VKLNQAIQVAIGGLPIDEAVLGVDLPVPLIDSLRERIEAPSDLGDVGSTSVEIQALFPLVLLVCHTKVTEDSVAVPVEKTPIEEIATCLEHRKEQTERHVQRCRVVGSHSSIQKPIPGTGDGLTECLVVLGSKDIEQA